MSPVSLLQGNFFLTTLLIIACMACALQAALKVTKIELSLRLAAALS